MSATLKNELPVFTTFYDLLVWSLTRAEGFPRVLRSTLTHRFCGLLMETMEQLVDLRYTRERQPLLRTMNLKLTKLRIWSRVLKDRRAFSIDQYEYFNRVLDEVGRMLGGWLKASAGKTRGQP